MNEKGDVDTQIHSSRQLIGIAEILWDTELSQDLVSIPQNIHLCSEGLDTSAVPFVWPDLINVPVCASVKVCLLM